MPAMAMPATAASNPGVLRCVGTVAGTSVVEYSMVCPPTILIWVTSSAYPVMVIVRLCIPAGRPGIVAGLAPTGMLSTRMFTPGGFVVTEREPVPGAGDVCQPADGAGNVTAVSDGWGIVPGCDAVMVPAGWALSGCVGAVVRGTRTACMV